MGNTQNRPADPPFLSPSPASNPAPPPQLSPQNVAPPPFISTPPPHLAAQNVARPLISPQPPPPNGARAPTVSAALQVSQSYAPAPLILPHAADRHSDMIRHHYALIAGTAAAVFLALLVLGILVLKRKKVPEGISADTNGRPQVQASAEVRSEDVGGTSGNAKKDLGSNGNSNNEHYVITLNVYSSPGHGRRRTNIVETLAADVAGDRRDGTEKEGVARSASSGAHELRTDDLSKSGRVLGERNRDARSVRTRNFAAARTNS